MLCVYIMQNDHQCWSGEFYNCSQWNRCLYCFFPGKLMFLCVSSTYFYIWLLCVCVCSRYECSWLNSLETGCFSSLPAPCHHNIDIQVDVVTQWQTLLFNLFMDLFFLKFVQTAVFGGFLSFLEANVLFCSVSVRVRVSTRSECSVRFYLRFIYFFQTQVCFDISARLEKNASFQLFILNDANALLLFTCQSSFSLLVVISTCFQHFIPHG